MAVKCACWRKIITGEMQWANDDTAMTSKQTKTVEYLTEFAHSFAIMQPKVQRQHDVRSKA